MASVILDLDGLSYELLFQTLYFCQRHNLPCAITEDDIKVVEPIVAMMVDDLVSRRLRWATCNTDRHLLELKKMIPWYVDDQEIPANVPYAHQSVQYYHDVYDVFVDELEILLGRAIPQRTWFTWSILTLKGSLVLQKGQDWRVLEWERLTGYTAAKRVKNTKPKKRVKPTPVTTTQKGAPVIRKKKEGTSRSALKAVIEEQQNLRETQAQEDATNKQLKGPITRV